MKKGDCFNYLHCFSQCGITNQEGLCDYTNRNFTNANDDVTIAEAGPGVYTAMWQLSLALVFKLLVTIFTFGIKGTKSKSSVPCHPRISQINCHFDFSSCWLVHSLPLHGCDGWEDGRDRCGAGMTKITITFLLLKD